MLALPISKPRFKSIIFFIKIALKLRYFCKKCQIFERWVLRTQTPKTAPPIANFWLRACPEMDSVSHKSCAASATTLKIFRYKLFRKLKKIFPPQVQPLAHAQLDVLIGLFKFTNYARLHSVRNHYSKQIMHAAKSVNKKYWFPLKNTNIWKCALQCPLGEERLYKNTLHNRT